MAYAGSTAAEANPPYLLSAMLAGSTHGQGESTAAYAYKQWIYKSTHLSTEVGGVTDFITDGGRLGMQLGDSVILVGSTVYISAMVTVNAVGSTGNVTLSQGFILSSAS